MDETPKPRLQDYEILAKIGSGGFGDVYKVMYTFDKQHYALKKIAVQNDNRRQISREVSCFSRLNHENVVRYYSAWIELNDSEEHDSDSDDEKQETSEKDSPLKETDELRLKSNGFSMSYVVFQTSTSQQQSDEADDDSESVISERRDSSSDKNSKIMHLYIQMELCEGNTLRDAIKSHSFLENDLRKRRLFKEIVKGLAYIHEQGIIHRDLNPRNIFLDSRDHVKIGDFGLAMTKMKDSEHTPSAHKPLRTRNAQNTHNSHSLTYVGGTLHYMPPELKFLESGKINVEEYTEKVDIYSLGIIFFEMCYPMETEMERNAILTNIRSRKRKFPKDISKHIKDIEMDLIKKMLSYYPAHRPTSLELSKSPYLPPPELEETEQLNIIRKIVADPKSKSHLLRELVQSEYKHLSNTLSVKHENGYTNETFKQLCTNLRSKGAEFRFVCSTIKKVLKKYCFSLFSLPLFLPNPASKNQENYNLYEVMDRSGCVLCPPHDLRLTFARYVAMNDIKYMRRFDIQKVFRQSSNSANNSPDELWQCSFDFVVSQKSNSAVSCHLEIITILNEIINEFPALRLEACNLRLNHTKLMDSIRSYYNVIDERLFQNFVTVKQLKDVLRKQVKAKQNAKSHYLQEVNESLNEISEVIQLIKKNRDSYFKLQICPNLAFDSTAGQSLYSGLIFQVDFEVLVRGFDSKKKEFKRKIIAFGGQYNEVIEQFEREFSVVNGRSDDSHLIAVGATIDLEIVVNCELADKDSEKEIYGSEVDVLIWCSEEISSDVNNEVVNMCQNLRSLDLKVDTLYSDALSTSDISSLCVQKLSTLLMVIKEDRRTAFPFDIFIYRRIHKTFRQELILLSDENVIESVKSLFSVPKSAIMLEPTDVTTITEPGCWRRPSLPSFEPET